MADFPPTMTSAEEAKAMPIVAEPSVAPAPQAASLRWRSAAEAITIPVLAILAGFLVFGLFCATQGPSPLGVFKAIYKAAFGSWYSWQNTLVRASPLMLTALCTALPARLGLIVIGNEGALVVGGVASAAAGLFLAAAPMPVLLTGMALAGMVSGRACVCPRGTRSLFPAG